MMDCRKQSESTSEPCFNVDRLWNSLAARESQRPQGPQIEIDEERPQIDEELVHGAQPMDVDDGWVEDMEIDELEHDAVSEEEVEAGKSLSCVLKSNEVTGEEITVADEWALGYLKDIICSPIENEEGFKLEFLFEENPFFKNSVLTKEYHVINGIVETAFGCEIHWHGCPLTHRLNGELSLEPCQSFFRFFSAPAEGDLDLDHYIGSTIRRICCG